jgi:hypothetical protein
MKRLVVGIVAATVLASMARTAAAQSKTVTSEMKVQKGTVEAIDPERRMVTLKKTDGTFVTIVAGPDITRFSEVKVGDTVTARYYENLVVRLKHPGESEVDSKVKSTTPSYQELPGGTKATQRTITATITAIDPATPSITFTVAARIRVNASLENVPRGRMSPHASRPPSYGQDEPDYDG